MMTTSRATQYLLFAAYFTVLCLLSYSHEPWRDEVEMWLLARDAGLAELIAMVPFMGTPLLWPLLLKPLALSGLPIESMQLLHSFIAALSAALIIFCSPFPLYFRMLLCTGYYLGFEYSVVARNYGLGVLLLFLLATMDRQRQQRPYLFGIAIALLAHTSVHFWFFASILLLVLIVEVLFQKQQALWPAVLISAFGVTTSFLLLLPRGGGQFSGGLVSQFRPEAIPLVLEGSLFPYRESEALVFASFLIWFFFFVSLLGKTRTFCISALGLFSLLYVVVCKHLGGIWHYGLAFILLVYTLWISHYEKRANLKGLQAKTVQVSTAAFYLFFTASLIASTVTMVRMYYPELAEKHSWSRDTAKILKRFDLLRYEISAHPAPVAAAVLGYLPGKQFYYPSREEHGTHMRWDSAHTKGRHISHQEVVQRTKKRFPNWNSFQTPVFLLLNVQLEAPERYGYALFYASPDDAWRVEDERYYLYAPEEYIDGKVKEQKASTEH